MATIDWDPAEFQRTIFDWLARTGMSQNQAALTCGISQAVFNRWLQPDARSGLVQPSGELLERLVPHIGISHDELLRMAGRRKVAAPVTDDPPELQAFLRDQREGYLRTAEHERPIRMEVARAAWPERHVRRRSNPRIRGNNAGQGNPKMDYRVHK